MIERYKLSTQKGLGESVKILYEAGFTWSWTHYSNTQVPSIANGMTLKVDTDTMRIKYTRIGDSKDKLFSDLLLKYDNNERGADDVTYVTRDTAQVGDVLEVVSKTDACAHWDVGDRMTVIAGKKLRATNDRSFFTPNFKYYKFKRVSTQPVTERDNMNKVIAQLFDKTADAIIVEEELGSVIKGDQVEYIKLNGKQKELLAKAHEIRNAREKK